MTRASDVQKAYRVRHPEKARIAVALNSAKTRARRLGVPFALNPEDLPSIPDVCPVLGIRLTLWGNGHQTRDSSPSLDRIIAPLGYVPGNVAWISTRANILKRNATAEELMAVARYVDAGSASGDPDRLLDYLTGVTRDEIRAFCGTSAVVYLDSRSTASVVPLNHAHTLTQGA